MEDAFNNNRYITIDDCTLYTPKGKGKKYIYVYIFLWEISHASVSWFHDLNLHFYQYLRIRICRWFSPSKFFKIRTNLLLSCLKKRTTIVSTNLSIYLSFQKYIRIVQISYLYFFIRIYIYIGKKLTVPHIS